MQPLARLSWEVPAIATSVLVLAVLLAFAWRYRNQATGRWFLAFVALASIWAAAYILELISPSLDGKVLWARVQYIGISFIPLTWLLMVVAYLRLPIPSPLRWIMAIEPIGTLALVWIVPAPNWFWGSPALIASSGRIARIDYDYQWWFYYVHAPYGYVLLAIAIAVVLWAITRVHRGYRTPLILLLLSIVIPLLSDFLYIIQYPPFSRVNPTTMVMGISGLIIGFVLRRYHFLSIVPVARTIVFDTMTDGVVVLDNSGKVVDINSSAVKICECSRQVIGRPIREAGPSSLAEAMVEMARSDDPLREVPVEGARFGKVSQVYEIGLSPLHDHHGERSGSIFTLREVTDRVHLYEQVRQLSILDDLTGVYNRRSFMEAGAREIDLIRRNAATSLGVLLVDLDDFKSINDNYGHSAGDGVLKAVADAARTAIRSIDVLGRIGGDEFATILPNVGDDAARSAAARLRKAIAGVSIAVPAGAVPVTASIGVATTEACGSDIPDLDQLLNAADAAMYRAKRAGKNRIG